MEEAKIVCHTDESKQIAYLEDMNTGKCYGIPVGCWSIGRKDDIDLNIPIETDDLYMSREHAYIWLKKNIIGEYALYIRDTVSRLNRTEVNGVPIDQTYEYQVFDKNIINMGRTYLTVHLNPIFEG